jgi:predicted nucleotide-binding protein (sugar kinase/HSP70/actin superfamily)
MGPGAEALAACFRGIGVRAEVLPMPNRKTVLKGRRYTSGKECVPMCVTTGSLLQRLESEKNGNEQFTLFMPTAHGPCRFGVYNMLHRAILEHLGWEERVKIWSPEDSGYFDGLPPGFSVLVFSSVMAADLLLDCLHHVRPVEEQAGSTERIYRQYQAELADLLERQARRKPSLKEALFEVGTKRLFGLVDLLQKAGRHFQKEIQDRALPTVLLVGEIYVRSDPFTNDFIIEKLEQRGLRVRLAPTNEFLEYTDWINLKEGRRTGVAAYFSNRVQNRIQRIAYEEVARFIKWPPRTSTQEMLSAAGPYLRDALIAESVLTLGGPIHEWRSQIIDGVVNVGPLECMPTKIAEAQFYHVAVEEGLLALTVSFNGDPMDICALDNFAFEVHKRSDGGSASRNGEMESAPSLERI